MMPARSLPPGEFLETHFEDMEVTVGGGQPPPSRGDRRGVQATRRLFAAEKETVGVSRKLLKLLLTFGLRLSIRCDTGADFPLD